jgi:hypothetical protein
MAALSHQGGLRASAAPPDTPQKPKAACALSHDNIYRNFIPSEARAGIAQ